MSPSITACHDQEGGARRQEKEGQPGVWMGKNEMEWERGFLALTALSSPGAGIGGREERGPMGCQEFLSPSFLSLLPSSCFCGPLTHRFPSKIFSKARRGKEAGLISTLQEEERGFTGWRRSRELQRTLGALCAWENKRPEQTW